MKLLKIQSYYSPFFALIIHTYHQTPPPYPYTYTPPQKPAKSWEIPASSLLPPPLLSLSHLLPRSRHILLSFTLPSIQPFPEITFPLTTRLCACYSGAILCALCLGSNSTIQIPLRCCLGIASTTANNSWPLVAKISTVLENSSWSLVPTDMETPLQSPPDPDLRSPRENDLRTPRESDLRSPQETHPNLEQQQQLQVPPSISPTTALSDAVEQCRWRNCNDAFHSAEVLYVSGRIYTVPSPPPPGSPHGRPDLIMSDVGKNCLHRNTSANDM